MKFWILKAQNEGKNGKSFEEERARLNLQPNEEGVLGCRGRIQGEFPIYLPDTSLFSQKLVADAHGASGELHGGVARGSWLHDDEGSEYLLDTTVEKAGKESDP